MIRPRLSAVVVALTVGVAGLLSGCSGSEPAAAPAASTAAPATSAAPESTSPQSSEPASDAPKGAKPSKKQVVDGYTKIVKGVMSGLPDDLVRKVTGCFVDEVYDKASVKTLRAIADADATGIDPADSSLFTDAQQVCQKKLTS